jgi:hypothetical protein
MQRELTACGLLLVALIATSAAVQAKPKVYVVDFATRDLEKNTQTANFTRDFEQALVQAGCYTVLESREFSRLLTELDRERAIADVADLSKSALDGLKTEQAEMVVFGEVFDDVDSGQVNVTVTFQKFDRTKALIKSSLLARGKVNDAASRQEAMAALAGGLCRRTATVERMTENDFIFDLDECRIQERNVTCELLVTNNGEDRDLVVANHDKYGYQDYRGIKMTRMYDDFSGETLASRILLARRESDRDNAVRNTLISGRPAELELTFEGVSSKATIVTRLNVECWESEHESAFTVTFRNIPLKR